MHPNKMKIELLMTIWVYFLHNGYTICVLELSGLHSVIVIAAVTHK